MKLNSLNKISKCWQFAEPHYTTTEKLLNQIYLSWQTLLSQWSFRKERRVCDLKKLSYFLLKISDERFHMISNVFNRGLVFKGNKYTNDIGTTLICTIFRIIGISLAFFKPVSKNWWNNRADQNHRWFYPKFSGGCSKFLEGAQWKILVKTRYFRIWVK